MDQTTLKKSKIDFVLIEVRAEGEELSKCISALMALAEQHGASSELLGGILMMSYGALADDQKAEDESESLLEDLKRQYPSGVKILHGPELGYSGFFVGSRHIAYNIILPHLTKARHRLEGLNWGEVEQFNPKAADG
jgi:hypothetical protein